jgi:hypothetical protein
MSTRGAATLRRMTEGDPEVPAPAELSIDGVLHGFFCTFSGSIEVPEARRV